MLRTLNRRSICVLASTFLAVALGAERAATGQDLTNVDLELSLLVDVSGSVDSAEYALQKQGYVNAFNNAAVYNAITDGSRGAIAVNLVYWSSYTQQQEAVAWMLVDDATSSQALATAIDGTTRPFSGGTNPGPAIDFAVPLFGSNTYTGSRLVIDVSGDGSGYEIDTETARDNAVANGITVNGIVLQSQSVLQWYIDHLIGGPDAFAEFADTFEDFEDAVLDKLLAEISGVTGLDSITNDVAQQLLIARNMASIQMTNVGSRLINRRYDAPDMPAFYQQDQWFMPQPSRNALAMSEPAWGEVASMAALAAAVTGAEEDADDVADEQAVIDHDRPWVTARASFWGNARIMFGEQDVVGGSDEDYLVLGGTIGYDTRITDRVVAGIGVGYSATDVDQMFGGDMDIDAVTLIVYGSYSPREQWWIDGMLAYTTLDYDISRGIPGGGGVTAESDPSGRIFSTQWRVGYDMRRDQFAYGPTVRVDYSHAEIDGYTESGAGPLNAIVSGESADSLQTRLGGHVSYIWERQNCIIAPQVRAYWAHEFLDDDRTVRAGLASAPGIKIGVPTGDPDRDFVDLGTGVSVSFDNGLTLLLEYDTILGNSNYTANTVKVGVRFDF